MTEPNSTSDPNHRGLWHCILRIALLIIAPVYIYFAYVDPRLFVAVICFFGRPDFALGFGGLLRANALLFLFVALFVMALVELARDIRGKELPYAWGLLKYFYIVTLLERLLTWSLTTYRM